MGKHDELTKYIKIRGAREHNLILIYHAMSLLF